MFTSYFLASDFFTVFCMVSNEIVLCCQILCKPSVARWFVMSCQWWYMIYRQSDMKTRTKDKTYLASWLSLYLYCCQASTLAKGLVLVFNVGNPYYCKSNLNKTWRKYTLGSWTNCPLSLLLAHSKILANLKVEGPSQIVLL